MSVTLEELLTQAQEKKAFLPSQLPVSVSRQRIESFCRARGIRRLALFGSVLRDDFGQESDVDVLVEFQPGKTPGLFALIPMEAELSDIFAGKKIDLKTPAELSRYFRQQVLEEALTLYDAEGSGER